MNIFGSPTTTSRDSVHCVECWDRVVTNCRPNLKQMRTNNKEMRVSSKQMLVPRTNVEQMHFDYTVVCIIYILVSQNTDNKFRSSPNVSALIDSFSTRKTVPCSNTN